MVPSSKLTALLVAWVAMTTSSVCASTIEIHVTGLDLTYNGSDLYDAASIDGGNGDSGLADPLETMDFFVDGTLVGTLSTVNGDSIFADVRIEGVSPIPFAGGLLSTAGNGDDFGFDFLTSLVINGWGLALNIDTFEGFFSSNGLALAMTGLATSLPFQDLPFGIEFDPNETISIIFSSTQLTNVVVDGGGIVTSFNASGTASVVGTIVPEPSSWLLLSLGAAGLLFFANKGVSSRFRAMHNSFSCPTSISMPPTSLTYQARKIHETICKLFGSISRIAMCLHDTSRRGPLPPHRPW